MNTGNAETTQADHSAAGRASRSTVNLDELFRLKQELMHTEVCLARARAAVVSAEIDQCP